ncbi:MAG: NAD-dependent epimerase/dehydratase family protein [Acidobacteria bacterium]|nr:NAD-dependent epimerase/dehydratase family protein [Acidobacteriota bacterium]
MRVLVTGATGYLGRAVTGAVAERGHTAVAFARRATSSGLPCAAVDGDIRDETAVLRAAAGCDAIIHMAALVTMWSRRAADFDDVNVGGLRTVLRAAAALGVPRVLYTSSFLALPPSGAETPYAWNDYQRTKVAADRVARAAEAQGAPIVRLYPGVVYGPGPMTEGNLIGRMIAEHLAGRLPGLIGASRRCSYAFIDDVAGGYVAALERGTVGGQYSLGGENVPQRRVFEIVRDLTGAPLPRAIPLAAAVPVALFDEARAWLWGIPPRLTLGTVEVLDRDWDLDSDLARRELGYRITPLEAGIARVVNALRGQGGQPGRVDATGA